MSSDVQPVQPAPPEQMPPSFPPFAAYEMPQPKRDSFPWRAFAAGLATGAMLVGAVWGLTSIANSTDDPPVAESFTLKGTMTLMAGGFSSASCRGSGGYSDISAGTSVTVYGASGTVVGNGYLGSGTGGSSAVGCSFPIEVSNVPSGEKFYQVEVSHRGKITVSAEDAKAGLVAVSLGR